MIRSPYRILFLNTYYDGFLQTHYNKNIGLEHQSYQDQLRSLQETCFGDSDFYSHGITEAGWTAADLIINARHLQAAWANEQGLDTENLLVIAAEQVRQFQPDVIYLQDISPITSDLMAILKASSRLIAWQIASPIPDGTDLSGVDIIFSSFPHFVERFRQQGKTAWYQPLAFRSAHT